MEWRRGGLKEKNEEVRRRGHAQPYIWHSNGAPWAGAPLLFFYFFYLF